MDTLPSGEADEDPEELPEQPVAKYPEETGDLWTMGLYTQTVPGGCRLQTVCGSALPRGTELPDRLCPQYILKNSSTGKKLNF
ncbi:placenta-specific gene 8 protein isoform X2 [Chelonia mydas]|uniref:placenta-specific gene 8 protein isoform X2 n=1 Tax=Chelonia mydas TaxID=8469 RepID=UPI0018A1E009|nr:placenta-specific gene 8 protein isoform X2 [Chelonia mydas]